VPPRSETNEDKINITVGNTGMTET